ncbi:MAG: response regulator [Rhodocyclaceae bacterium]|nr:response regulator [Rhodocyclaceae bacterium]
MTDIPARAPKPTILVVDDTPANLSLMSDILEDDYIVKLAPSGARALKIVANALPDLILLDIMMPEMDGYEVCVALKTNPATRDIPVIFVTALDSTEDEARGLALGAIDYLTKPVNPAILCARVRTHLTLHNQTLALQEWNHTLEQRVEEESARVERLDRLRRFFSPAVAEKVIASENDDVLAPRQREIVVVFLDLRGYTAFTEKYGAEVVMRVLAEFHAAMGKLVMRFGGTLERFTGDGMMIFFNDPVEIADPAGTALNMVLAMQEAFVVLEQTWSARGYTLTMGIGVAKGLATIGAIVFDGRRDYGAIGGVTNLAARLCGEAEGGQILMAKSVVDSIADIFGARQIGELTLKGFAQPQPVFELGERRAVVRAGT